MNGDDLRARLAQGTPVLMPGVWDALSARLVVLAGFDTVFVSGFCVSGTRLGVPDFGYLTQTEMAETGGRVPMSRPPALVQREVPACVMRGLTPSRPADGRAVMVRAWIDPTRRGNVGWCAPYCVSTKAPVPNVALVSPGVRQA